MTPPPAPIRFLLLVVGGWVTVRLVAIFAPWADPTEEASIVRDVNPSTLAATPPAEALQAAPLPEYVQAPPPAWSADHIRVRLASTRDGFRPIAARAEPGPPARPLFQFPSVPPLAGLAPTGTRPSPALIPQLAAEQSLSPLRTRRLAGSAWLFVRDRDDAGLAPGGTLGGSQAGLRLTYRLNGDARRPLSVSARLYAPLDRAEAAEAAVGIDWRPIAGLPLNLLAERRQRIGREGRSDFSLTLYGGVERRLLRERVRIEAYGQAGVVGIEERDLFADGAIVATTRVGPVEVGGGAWGGAQPGVARLDVGPHAGFRLPVGPVTIRAVAEWRFRVAGDAAPASGPALTLSAGF